MPAEVENLEQASRMMAKVAWGNERRRPVGEAIEAMHRSRNMADAGMLMAVRSYSARGEHRVDGHVNVAAYLQQPPAQEERRPCASPACPGSSTTNRSWKRRWATGGSA